MKDDRYKLKERLENNLLFRFFFSSPGVKSRKRNNPKNKDVNKKSNKN